MKFVASIATIAALALGAASAQLETKYFMEEPADIQSAPQTLAGADDQPVFKTFAGYKLDSTFTNSSSVAASAVATTNATNQCQLQEAEVAVAVLQVAAAVVPIIAGMFKGTPKDCQQLACWVSTNSKTCALAVAEKVQTQITQGRDRYSYESIQSNGMWVRYWRTKFEPADRGNIATGKCTNGSPFTVTNCQSTGRVVC